MNDKNYKKKYELQNKMISRQIKQIESLKLQVNNLNLELKKKDEIIGSIDLLRSELAQNVSEINKYKEEYKNLVEELRKMKEVINKTYYKGKWSLIKLLIK